MTEPSTKDSVTLVELILGFLLGAILLGIGEALVQWYFR